MLKKLDLSNHDGRVFVVGDIHGAFSKLEGELEKLGFDWDKDVLLSVGDLVDRGPESERALEFLSRPNFHAVQGNHEQITYQMGGTSLHTANGGKWYTKLKFTTRDVPTQAQFNQAFKALPIALEVLLPSGKKIGLIHACYADPDWNNVESYIHERQEEALWDRYFLSDLKRNTLVRGEEPIVKNIDAIYHGHTPMKEPFSCGNRHYIDTGAVFDHAGYGKFTIVEVS